MEDGSEAEEALQCTGVADSIRKLTDKEEYTRTTSSSVAETAPISTG